MSTWTSGLRSPQRELARPPVGGRSPDPPQTRAEAPGTLDVGLDTDSDVTSPGAIGLHDRRGADCERSGRHLDVVEDHGIGGDDRAGVHDRPVQHHGAVADHRTIADRAPLQMDEVADDTLVADHRRIDRSRVEHTVVLDARATPDADLPIVTTQDRTRPDTALGPERHRADDDGVRMDIGIGMDVGNQVVEGIDGHAPTVPDGTRGAPGRVTPTTGPIQGSSASTAMEFGGSEPVRLRTMSRRIDIELTSSQPDGSWTWRAAGAKVPKGVLDGTILPESAKVGDVLKVDAEQEIDGITVTGVVQGRQKPNRDDRLELLIDDAPFEPVVQHRAERDRPPRRDRGDRRDRGERRDRGDRRDRPDRGERTQRDDDRGPRGGERRERRPDERRDRPSFTPPPELPKRPKPKRLRPSTARRDAVLAELPEEQRPIAELALQGIPAVRQRVREENERLTAAGKAPMPEASVLKIAEELLPRLRVAEWHDRAEAAQRQIAHLDLRDLRSVVAAADDPIVARDESTRAVAEELRLALQRKQDEELQLWLADIATALDVGRVIRALRLSSQPPKAGVPFPAELQQRLADAANASLSPADGPDRWSAVLEAAAFSPVRGLIAPTEVMAEVPEELRSTLNRLAPALPKVAAAFAIEVAPGTPMPKPLRPGPPRQKAGARPARERGGAS